MKVRPLHRLSVGAKGEVIELDLDDACRLLEAGTVELVLTEDEEEEDGLH